ncbi:MAG: FAD-dependent oxidoreductase, partial [Pyrinomonadaceae bacterium]
ALGLWRSPSKLAQAVALRRKLVGVPYLTDSWIKSANGSDRLESVSITRKGKSRMIECDMLACGFHLVGNTELAALLACRIENGFVVVDEFQKTTSENIFCAGDPTGIGGVESSLVEGRIAGFAAVGETKLARQLFGIRSKARKFGDSLNRTFALRDELRSLPEPDTIVCRCEDVVFGQLINFESWRSSKLQTRCGMGSCQGRICGAAIEYLFGWKTGDVRPPIFPVKLENL